jgi:hypothetical protein
MTEQELSARRLSSRFGGSPHRVQLSHIIYSNYSHDTIIRAVLTVSVTESI